METGHSARTANQSRFAATRLKVTISSSASKVASNASPGMAGATEAGKVSRRLESIVMIMVGSSHHQAACQDFESDVGVGWEPLSAADEVDADWFLYVIEEDE